jgi:hypothetical protein
MAKYFVADDPTPTTVSGTSVVKTTGEFSFEVSNTGIFAVGDVVKYFDTASKATAFGVVYATSAPSGTGTVFVGFDDRIYTETFAASGLITVFQKTYLPTLGVNISNLDGYTISEELSQAFYSTSYIRYNIEKRYRLIVDNKKRLYLNDFGTLLTQNPLFFVDDCEYEQGVAYSIAAEERTTEFINNQFKQRVEFRIATK